MLGTRPTTTPIDPNSKLSFDEDDMLEDPKRYKYLVGKLNYLTITQPDISSITSVVNQYKEQSHSKQLDAVMWILRYLKGNPNRRLLYKNDNHLIVQGF